MNTPENTDRDSVDSTALFDVGLSDAERERLAFLLEECGEVQQAIGKILRHGYQSTHPDGGPTNREMLNREIGDIMAAVEMMNEAGDVGLDCILRCCGEKRRKVGRYLHFSSNSR